MSEVRVTIKPRNEIDVEKLALALLAISESLPPEEQDRLAADGALIAERLNLYPKRKTQKRSAA